MLYALGRHLHGKGLSGIGVFPAVAGTLSGLINALPRHPRGNAGAFIGVDENESPFDLASFLRHDRAAQQQVHGRVSLPSPLTFDEFAQFIATFGGHYRVQ